MLKTILLLNPVYTTIFWFILLVTSKTTHQYPKRFLGIFMGTSVFIYVSHFAFFSDQMDVYYYMDPFYQFASLMVYPLYHIYFRLLMVEERITVRNDGLYVLLPVILFLFYFSGFLTIPATIFKEWLGDKSLYNDHSGIHFMNLLKRFMQFVFIAQALYVMVVNFMMINRYRDKAEQYYSDIQDSRINGVLMLNITLVVTSVSSIVLSALGKDFFKHETVWLALASFIFSVSLFLIGWLGYKQKSVNPYYDIPTDTMEPVEDLPLVKQRFLLDSISKLFDVDRVYLNSNLTIQDVAISVGTNRTYVSAIINQTFNLNFCRFVNEFRIVALQKSIKEHPNCSYNQLAEQSGFGSVDSMKRAIYTKTCLSFSEWRQQLLLNPSID